MATPRDTSGWLPTLIGPLALQGDGVEVTTRRATLNFTNATVTDDPDFERTNITLSAAGGLDVPGNSGDFFFNDADTLGATPRIREVDDTLVFDADYHEFKAQGVTGSGVPRSYALKVSTSDATLTELPYLLIDESFGICRVTVIAEVNVAYAAGGGNLSARATFKRITSGTGTLSRIAITDSSDTDQWEGTAVGGIDLVALNDDGVTSVVPKVTGIAATDINWTWSIHVIITPVPA